MTNQIDGKFFKKAANQIASGNTNDIFVALRLVAPPGQLGLYYNEFWNMYYHYSFNTETLTWEIEPLDAEHNVLKLLFMSEIYKMSASTRQKLDYQKQVTKLKKENKELQEFFSEYASLYDEEYQPKIIKAFNKRFKKV